MRVTSTRNPALRQTFVEAAAANTPPDGGLYLPLFGSDGWTPFADVPALLDLPWRERAARLLARLLAPEVDDRTVEAMVDAAFDFPVVRREIDPTIAALELFHGPSLSFKDFGVRFLARVLAWLRARSGEERPQIVLTATSGDTGAAVVHAFHRLPGFSVVVLYPAGRISPLQERQIATVGENVQAFAVSGSFDDCQELVKRAFADPDLGRRVALVSANSIHLARLLAQIPYYFEAAAASPRDRPLVVAVPSGNFGNLTAGLLALRLGAPIARLVAATNANRTVPEFLDGAPWRPRPSVATLSNAMDVGAPNNWERVSRLFGDDAAAIRTALRWGSADDEETRAALRDLAAEGYRADPHGAVAFDVLRRHLRDGEQGLFLATAHPAKFATTQGSEAELPPALAAAARAPLRSLPMAAGEEGGIALRRELLALTDRSNSAS